MRRLRTAVTLVVTGLLAAYGTGVVTGALTQNAPAPVRGKSVIDQAEQKIAASSARPISTAALQKAAVEGMLKALDDKWAQYYAPADFTHFEQVLSGSYTGVGIWVSRTAKGTLVITSVEPQTPAATAGLRKGDVLTRVGRRSVSGRSVADVVSALRGNPGTRVTVQVRRNDRIVTASLKRATVNDDDVRASMITSDIEMLHISAFTSGVGAWVRQQTDLAAEHHLAGLVVDLRNNPGGLLDEAVETASAWLANGPIVSYVQRGHAPQQLDALGGGNTAIPLVVLVNGGTASAAEIVAAALQDRGRAMILGSQTFGKNSVQEPERLSDGSAFEITVGHYVTPNGRSLDNVGITPDVEIPPGTPQGIVDQRAISVLSGLTADAGSTSRG